MAATTQQLSVQKEQNEQSPLMGKIKTEKEFASNDGCALSGTEMWQIITNEQSSSTKLEDSCLSLHCVRVKDEPEADGTNDLHTGLEVELTISNSDVIATGLVSEQLHPKALQLEMPSHILAPENKVRQNIINEQSSPSVTTQIDDSCLLFDYVGLKDDLRANETNAVHIGLQDELRNPDFICNGLISKQLRPKVQQFETSSPILALEKKVTQPSFKMEEHEHREITMGNDCKLTHELVPFVQKHPLNFKRDDLSTQEANDICCQNEVQADSSEHIPSILIGNESISASAVKPCKENKSLLKLNHDFDEKLLANVSVRLEDIFSGNTKEFGNGHSAVGSCSCIFCEGKFKITDVQFLPKMHQRPIVKVTSSGLKLQNFKIDGVQHEASIEALVKVEPLVKCAVDTKPLVCDLCPAIFKRRTALWKHKRQHFKTDAKPFKCKECGKGFKNNCALKHHSKKHISERPFKCTFCTKTYKHVRDLNGHVKLHTGENVFKCNLCPKMFDAKSKLETHLRVHSNERPYSCELCPAKFKQCGQLPVHMRCVHRDERLFNCSQCFAPFKQRGSLNAHMTYAHTAKKPFKCDQCPAAFKDKRYLKNHKYIHIRNRLWECDTCKKSFKSKDRLRFHVIAHSTYRLFNCDHCSRKFKAKTHLYHHVLFTHINEERKFRCEHCGANFKSKEAVRAHLLVHNDDRPFSCTLCPATYKFKTSLSEHEAIHSGVKPYTCEICNAKFTRKGYLKKHRLLHDAERPYKCADCGFASKHKGSIIGHIKSIHSSERPFKCKHCSLAFKLARILKVHVAKMHFESPSYP